MNAEMKLNQIRGLIYTIIPPISLPLIFIHPLVSHILHFDTIYIVFSLQLRRFLLTSSITYLFSNPIGLKRQHLCWRSKSNHQVCCRAALPRFLRVTGPSLNTTSAYTDTLIRSNFKGHGKMEMEDESRDRYMDSQSFNATFMLDLAQAKFPPFVIKPGGFYYY